MKPEILTVLAGLKQASEPGKKEDGTRVHVQYRSFGKPTPAAIELAKRAEELGLTKDRYTGRVSRIWKSGAGDRMLTVLVELERDHQFRTFNLDKGEVLQLVVLGD
jgi:hypothetical protein